MLLHRKQRLAGGPVENEHQSHLRNLGNRWDRLAILSHGNEHRLCWRVIIPNVVVHHLEVPAPVFPSRPAALPASSRTSPDLCDHPHKNHKKVTQPAEKSTNAWPTSIWNRRQVA